MMKEFSIFLLLLTILFSVACWGGLSPTNRQTHPIGYNVTMVEVLK